MTRRFSYAIDITQAGQQPLLSLAQAFAGAIQETEIEGLNPMTDPAVLLMGTFIAFQTHADVNTRNGYERLIALCHDRLNAAPPEIQ